MTGHLAVRWTGLDYALARERNEWEGTGDFVIQSHAAEERPARKKRARTAARMHDEDDDAE